MNQNKSKDIWIGVIALVVIGGLGIWLLMSNVSSSNPTATTATTTIATSTSPTTTTTTNTATTGSIQTPQVVDRSSQTVAAIAENLSGATQFGALISSTGVAAQYLKGAGPYTIFVPTNGAISQLPPARSQALQLPARSVSSNIPSSQDVRSM